MTMPVELPELPPEYKRLGQVSQLCSFGPDGMKTLEERDDSFPVFTSSQMQEYATKAVLAEREKCAQRCETLSDAIDLEPPSNLFLRGKMQGAWDCAAAIRQGTSRGE